MQDEHIRLRSTDSVNSVNRNTFVDVELQQHTKVFPFMSISDTIDQMELFEKERAESTKYRLILTINPYCSNVLFNAITEIVQNEGINKAEELRIASSTPFNEVGIDGYEIQGKESNVNNVDMVRNTEYSNGTNPFEYHCGYDIFNNHILRNQSFKLVCERKPNVGNKDYFNTIFDTMRTENGDSVKITKRNSINEIIKNGGSRHLYLREDILPFIDCINANLTEVNGWWGFYNRSSIPACKYEDNKWKDLKISKIFNGEYYNSDESIEQMPCKFIQMYPDSSLYSFTPKYNRLQNREEQNWDICITYPKENDDKKILVCGGTADKGYINALLLASYKQEIGLSGQDIIMFRSYVKHNLNAGDKIRLYYHKLNEGGNADFKEIEDRLFDVINIGNLKGDNFDYFFYINDVNDIKEIIGEKDGKVNENYVFRFVKVINERNCKYYYRKFKKLPNLKFKKEELTDEVVSDKYRFEEYIRSNCMKDDKEMLNFSKEQYQLAFSRTIYNDSNTQVVFTDTLDIDKLTDNLGRPLTEIFITVIKRNKGHDVWYKSEKTNEETKGIEFSHCFGKVTSGIEVYGEWSDDDEMLKSRMEISDCRLITNKKGEKLDDDITIESTDIFYGDVVELDVYNMNETVLSEVNFRFNTEQREHEFSPGELDLDKLTYDEINTDDYDLDGFEVITNEIENVTYRPEGYYYKAHYPIKVREFGTMRQGSYKTIDVSSCVPRQAGGMFIEVVSALRSGVSSGDTVFLCEDEKNLMTPMVVNSVQSNVRFLLSPIAGKSVFDICEGLTKDEDGKTKYVLRLNNTDIPSYAYKVDANTYLWRDILNVGNKDTIELTEYPFANGHFYINKSLNFFLKRQDPFNENGLYAYDKIPNDIYGKVMKENNYVYKDEEHRVC